MKKPNENISDNGLWELVKQSTKELNININKNTRAFPEKTKRETIENKEPKHIDTNFRKPSTNVKKPNNNKKPINISSEKKTLGVNRKSIKKMRAGNLNINSRLDLHGYKIKEAEIVFTKFIKDNYYLNKRNLLVISGKGSQGKGKIKQSIPIWLNNSPLLEMVYIYSSAALKDGGDGAFYICLRKTNN